MGMNLGHKLRDGASLHEDGANRITNEVVQDRLLAEADLSF
jgi:hypothetical protein